MENKIKKYLKVILLNFFFILELYADDIIVNDNNIIEDSITVKNTNNQSSYYTPNIIAGGFSFRSTNSQNNIDGNITTIIGKAFIVNLLNAYTDNNGNYIYQYSVIFNKAFNNNISAVVWANNYSVYIKQASRNGLIIEYINNKLPTQKEIRIFFAAQKVSS